MASSSSPPPSLTIRPATMSAADHELLIDFRDSQLPWLASIGSTAQWGTKSLRETDPAITDRTSGWVERSEQNAPWGTHSSSSTNSGGSGSGSGSGDGSGSSSGGWCRAFVAEARGTANTSNGSNGNTTTTTTTTTSSNETSTVPVAAIVLDSTAPAYVRSVLPEQDGADPFVYVAYLMSNRDAAAEKRKGAAAVLVDLAKDEVRKAGVKRLCLDCFSGNERKLVRYYESLGFKPIGEFAAAERDNWPCCVLEMRL